MPHFIITYLGGRQPSSIEEGKQHFAKYQNWLASLGSSAISPMNPLKNTRTINPDTSVKNGSSISMSGYTIIESASIDSALSTAKDCPFLELGGSLEVSELAQMPS